MNLSVAILAGGTGGHVMPALAVMEELRRRKVHLHWFGRRTGLEAEVAFGREVDYHCISAGGIRGVNPLLGLWNAIRMVLSCLRVWWLLRTLPKRPQVAIGFGGYVSVPSALACLLSGIPLVIHEQNAVLGSANRWLSRWAKQCLGGHESSFGKAGIYTGNPVREAVRHAAIGRLAVTDSPESSDKEVRHSVIGRLSIVDSLQSSGKPAGRPFGQPADKPASSAVKLSVVDPIQPARKSADKSSDKPADKSADKPVSNIVRLPVVDSSKPASKPADKSVDKSFSMPADEPASSPYIKKPLNLLVFGGSQGADCINQLLPEAVALLQNSQVQVRHLAGPGRDEAVAESYRKHGVQAQVEGFSGNMPDLYLWADLALCRAGAMTLAELAICGLPALLIPLRGSIDDHQMDNARSWQNGGAGYFLPEDEATPQSIAAALRHLSDAGRRQTMTQAAVDMSQSEADVRIVDCILQLVEAV